MVAFNSAGILRVGTLVLALSALITTSVSADMPPQAASERSCITTDTSDGYLDLYRQDGTAFASEGACHRYAATGKQLVHLAITRTGTYSDTKAAYFLSEESGYGLRPGSGVSQCRIFPNSDVCLSPRTVAADGTFAATNGMHREGDGPGPLVGDQGTALCMLAARSGLDGIYLVGTTAAGSPVRSRTAPARCVWP